MIEIKRTQHNNADFKRLINDLDAELKQLHGNYHKSSMHKIKLPKMLR